MPDETIILQTISWIKSVVIGCNFCPFAAKAMLRKSIRYVVLRESNIRDVRKALVREMQFLDTEDSIETTLIILPDSFADFSQYLKLVRKAELTIAKQGYEGIYQLASFHPDYRFAGTNNDDPANYTNRSVYPILHILRESSISHAVDEYPDTDRIPDNNIAYAREKGIGYMQLLLADIAKES